MILRFMDEIVLGLFGVLTIIINNTNVGPFEIYVLGGMMILAAILEAVVDVFEKKKNK